MGRDLGRTLGLGASQYPARSICAIQRAIATKSSHAKRGIEPALLVSQVRNTMPYLFDAPSRDELRAVPPASFVLAFEPDIPLDHFEYFRLCLSAHYLSCATPVPTDVDNAIRKRLWAPGLPLVTALAMGELVLASRQWDFTRWSARTSYGAAGSEWDRVPLLGHLGEWFTVASAAYAALGAYRAADAGKMRAALLQAIGDETERHSEVFGSVWRAKDGLGALLASASIAHNFGDLDRVVEMWEVPFGDPLRLRFSGLGTSAFDADQKLRHKGRLWTAGELYKSEIDGSSMALENHRHFALRKPRALRSSPELRIPLGPFFDAWGETAAARLDGEDLEEVVDALVGGWPRLPKTVGYGRALRAIVEARPDLEARTSPLVADPRWKRARKTTREEFERTWNDAAVALLDAIPSRA